MDAESLEPGREVMVNEALPATAEATSHNGLLNAGFVTPFLAMVGLTSPRR